MPTGASQRGGRASSPATYSDNALRNAHDRAHRTPRRAVIGTDRALDSRLAGMPPGIEQIALRSGVELQMAGAGSIGHRLGEQIALRRVTILLDQEAMLRLRLDTLGEHLLAEGA